MLWEKDKSEQELVELTKKKAIDGAFDAVIDLVNSASTAKTVFKCTHRVSFLLDKNLFHESVF